jgi:hypothetical protein
MLPHARRASPGPGSALGSPLDRGGAGEEVVGLKRRQAWVEGPDAAVKGGGEAAIGTPCVWQVKVGGLRRERAFRGSGRLILLCQFKRGRN